VDGRVIDLSHAAARAIDLLGPGVGPVRIEVIRLPETLEAAVFAVQVGPSAAARTRSGCAPPWPPGTARLAWC
jgi:rare lipoprotein A